MVQHDGVVVDLQRVSLRRDDTELLRGVDLRIRAGERWALLGPNGCGKTTLLSLIGASTHPTTGTVDLLGHRLGRVDVRGALWPRIGHVQSRHRPAGRLSAHQVVLTGFTGTNALLLRRRADPAHAAAARAGLARLGVDRLADMPWQVLSDGERRRVLLARALVHDPDLLLLDEPAAGLDLPAREQLVDALDDLADDRPDLAWVLVSHHVEELPSTTTHGALMRAGRLVSTGPAGAVLRDETMSACFDLPLRVRVEHGRWAASGVRVPRPRG